jgi:hypothetical protein
MEGFFPSHEQLFLLFKDRHRVFHTQHVSAQIGHHHVIHEKCTIDDRIVQDYNPSVVI